MNSESTEIKAPVIKITTAWLAALFSDFFMSLWHVFKETPWDKLAQFAAFIYTVCLIIEWGVKRWRKLRGSN